jgi:hypothetical protein
VSAPPQPATAEQGTEPKARVFVEGARIREDLDGTV